MYTFNCHHCGTQTTKKSSKAKYCSKSCTQRAYEKRKGIKKPEFLSKKVAKTIRVPSPVVHQANGAINISNDTIGLLKQEKQLLINQLNSIASKNENIIAFLSFAAGSYGAYKGYNFVTDKKLLGAFAGYALFSFVGSSVGRATIGKTLNEKESEKVSSIVRRIDELNQDITAEEVAQAAINERMNRIPLSKKYTSITADQLDKIDFETISIPGKYEDLLGSIERGFKMVMYGLPGSGKSTMLIDLSNDLKNFGKVVYVSAEEGIRASLRKKTRLMNVNSPYIRFESAETIPGIKKVIDKDTAFVMIDSITSLNVSPEAINQLYKQYPHISFIGILQTTKEGKYKGDAQLIHDADIVWKVEGFTATNEKNRYGGNGSVKLDLPAKTGIVRKIKRRGSDRRDIK